MAKNGKVAQSKKVNMDEEGKESRQLDTVASLILVTKTTQDQSL